MGETEEFNTLTFEKKLSQLKDTQESIQSLSSWCLKQRSHHKKIVSSWLNVLKRVKVEQRLVLFYLANDVIQYSKRKNYEFVESWGLNLQKATPLVRDEKVRHKILRIFKIWEQRSVYDDEFLTDLTGLLSAGAVKKTDDESLDFQPQQLVNKIKQCSVLEADTDLRLKHIHESSLQLSDADALCASLKDRRDTDEVEKELNEGVGCVERYTQALQREIVAREALLALLTSASQYYSTQRREVKIVAYAYKNFGARVRALKRKLDELIPTLPNAAPSPPQHDEDVPSPGPDEDLDLPNLHDGGDDDVSYNIDKTFNTSLTADGSLYNLGLSSFLGTENPMSIFNSDPSANNNNINSANKIEVINSRPSENQDFLNDILKTLIPNDNNTATSDNNSVISGTMSQKSQDTLPGLDLLTSDSTGNATHLSFYGAMDNVNDEPEQPYHSEARSPWASNIPSWNAPAPVPPPPPISSIPTLTSIPSLTSVPSLTSMPSITSLPSMSSFPPVSSIPLMSTLPSMPSLPMFTDTPESPPPAPIPPPIVPEAPIYTPELPPADVDHRGILPPPPPPPVLPGLGHMEDVDHRLLPTLPPPPPPVTLASTRHPVVPQDVDHRNLIHLTNQLPPPRLMNPMNMDQDYRVPPMVPHPSDIVESVDMDLSEDEDQRMFSNQNQSDLNRRQSYNNKVLVGGDNLVGSDNGKTKHEQKNTNLIRINSIPADAAKIEKIEAPVTAPILPPMANPFDNMPSELKSFNMAFPPNLPDIPLKLDDMEANTETYDEDLRSRGMEIVNGPRNPSPPEYNDYDPNMINEGDWQFQSQQRPLMNRFPRNWTPRTNFRPQFIPQQFWPRNVPRTPNRWMGPRPQRFW